MPLRELVLSLQEPLIAGRTGRGVAVAIIDSGINPGHPHLNGVAGGINLSAPGADQSDWMDRLGHGTAVAAAIHEKAPDAALHAVRVFDRDLRATAAQLAQAIAWATDAGLKLLNLSLGTPRIHQADVLGPAVQRALDRGALIVAASEYQGRSWLPGSLPGVVRVELDWSCARDQLRVTPGADGAPTFHASGYPRPIPGVPVERNLRGVSFAVANVTGLLARVVEEKPDVKSVSELADLLMGRTGGQADRARKPGL
ncbi:MAG TPA: S8 family serine peptidase [Gemmatimonadales bacterium]|nr:S8 family serine peptidase [Gemmatimonadales bacterium]